MSETNPWIHKECEKCGFKQRTRARKYWSCHRCGHKNYVVKTPALKPYKEPRRRKTGLDRFIRLLSFGESIPSYSPTLFSGYYSHLRILTEIKYTYTIPGYSQVVRI